MGPLGNNLSLESMMKHVWRSESASQLSIRDLRGIVLDWAGTTIDYGCLAPVEVFRAVFATIGIEVTEAEARGPMGQAKIDHIQAMLQIDRIQQKWQSLFGRPSRREDVQDLYEKFLPLQKTVLASHSDVIPGVAQAIESLQKQGVKIGSTTGYTRDLMDVVEPLAAAQGYAPEVTVCSDEVAAGRPAPWQVYRAAEKLGVFPMSQIAVVDDSIAGIQSGLHAGCWTIAVAMTGNALGLDRSSCESLPTSQLEERLERIAESFLSQGAHIVVDSIAHIGQI
jgi:phosphonoacetaldehyde hydrolase